MKNYTITEEQIKELAKGNKKVEKMFPQVFEQKKEVGNWYYLHSNGYQYLYCLQENNRCYGFFRGEWTYKSWSTTESFLANSRKATEEEVESALIKEAERRGFKYGVRVDAKNIGNGYYRNSVINSSNFNFEQTLNQLCLGNYSVFKDGKWAEVIKTKYLTKKQAEEELTKIQNDGYEYQIID